MSHTRKPVAFYVSLAKRLLAEHGDIELSALGLGALLCNDCHSNHGLLSGVNAVEVTAWQALYSSCA